MERESIELSSRYGMHTEEFSALMKRRVLDILLVASEYDAFVLEEDGQLTELIFEEYRTLDLNLRYAPRFVRASTAEEALGALAERKIDMVVTTPRLPDSTLDRFITDVKSRAPELPIGLLAAHAWDLPWLEPARQAGLVDWIFLWQGNVKALLAMIKQVEDRQNADHDILEGGVQAIILVEDEVRFYSAYLPHIYTEVTTQTTRLMAEGLNLSHRLLRIRARPKILLAQSYEQAWDLYQRYAGNLLGVISDVSFPRDGRQDPAAGLALARAIRDNDDDIPILLQSMERDMMERALEVDAAFLGKTSPTLLEDLRRFILEHFGFGDFVFRLPDSQAEVCRAADIRELLRRLEEAPDASLVHHASRNHFSAWLKARTEFELASLLRPRKVTEFASPAELRTYLISTLRNYLREIQLHVISDFNATTFDDLTSFSKVGNGSLGGKGRGLAFMHKLLAQGNLDLPGTTIAIPQTLVLASDVFEQYLDSNRLRSVVTGAPGLDDEEILAAFRRGRFPDRTRAALARFLDLVDTPLAVRSSSILEDSAYQPFAGVYATVMLPNSHPSIDVRLAQLFEAIKVVYASTYFSRARDYLESTPYRSEEELMAILIQRLVGRRRGSIFYPTFAGVASSYNFYPFGSIRPEDGVAQVALGLGKSVVEGFTAIRFCPRWPQILPQFSAVKDMLRNAQRSFYALDMSLQDVIPGIVTDANLIQVDVGTAVEDGTAAPIASSYSRADDTVTPGLGGGAPLITFAPLLKGRTLPLPEILTSLLRGCQAGIANPVEIEFAADLEPGRGSHQTFHVLQVRPLVVEKMGAEIELDDDSLGRAVVRSDVALGHGRREAIADIILVDPERLTRAATGQAAMAIEALNRELREARRHCILIGPGRWGTRDPWLGIPVAWAQISSARAIVETDFPDLQVEPSFGSHFFHNLTSFGVAFLVVHSLANPGSINWDWFARQPVVSQALDGAVRHLRLRGPAQVVVDGSTGRGVILESESE